MSEEVFGVLVERIQVLGLGPDDVVIVKIDGNTSIENKVGLAERLRQIFPNNKLVIVESALDLTAIKIPPDAPIYIQSK